MTDPKHPCPYCGTNGDGLRRRIRELEAEVERLQSPACTNGHPGACTGKDGTAHCRWCEEVEKERRIGEESCMELIKRRREEFSVQLKGAHEEIERLRKPMACGHASAEMECRQHTDNGMLITDDVCRGCEAVEAARREAFEEAANLCKEMIGSGRAEIAAAIRSRGSRD